MPVPYLEAHDVDPTGMTRGTYSHVPTTLRTIKGQNAVEIHHSLFEGDRMIFNQVRVDRDSNLDRVRPIRFYNKDPADGGIKLFDGLISPVTGYTYVSSQHIELNTQATGWWLELANMDLHHPIKYDDTWTVNEIYMDLVRLANNRAMMKQAVYAYDTDKIPEYNTYKDYYGETGTTIGTELVVTNVYQGMKTLTRFLDATVPCAYEFGLRVEALPRTDGIDQADTADNIYILPFPLNQDKASAATIKRFQCVTGFEIRRNYQRLANDCVAIGNGYDTQQIRTTKILDRVEITTDPHVFLPTNQPYTSHYLRITIDNPLGQPFGGTIQIHFMDGADIITDAFHIDATLSPPGRPATHVGFTSIRSHDGINLNLLEDHGIEATSFGPGCFITVEEVTNDPPSHQTTIAGKSLNQYGQHPHLIEGMWLNSQERVNLIAGKHCQLYHAPVHELSAPIISRYVSYTNLIGNVAELHNPYAASLSEFLITDVVYGFRGKMVTQHIRGVRHEFDWDYDDTNIYVLSGTDYVIVGTDYVVI